jgi:membrane protein YdbS with pleckstrin-like domain
VFGTLSRVVDPHVDKYLLAAQHEEIVDEVRRHPMAIFFPVLRLILAVLLFFSALLAGPKAGWVLVLASLVLGVQALWAILTQHMDRSVITNMRVFRVHGILAQNRATMPMSRILDITVEKPLVGRIFGYGHFVFESAAQDQGLRDIRFVGRPDERDLTIQTVIQRAGLRATAGNQPLEDDDA